MAKTFGYLSITKLNRYSSSSWKDANDLCHKVLNSKRFDLEKSNKCLDRLDFRRSGSLSQDDIMLKEKIYFDKYGMRIVGTTNDTFNENRIDMELKLLAKSMKQIRLKTKMMEILLVKKQKLIVRLHQSYPLQSII